MKCYFPTLHFGLNNCDRQDFFFFFKVLKTDVRFYHPNLNLSCQMSMHKQFPLLTSPGVQASDREAPQDVNKLQVFASSKATWEPPAGDMQIQGQIKQK